MAIHELFAIVRDAADIGLGKLGKQVFAAQMGRRIASELGQREKEMKNKAHRDVQGLIACGQAYLTHGHTQFDELKLAYQQRVAELFTPPGSPAAGANEVDNDPNAQVLVFVAFRTMATSMMAASRLSNNVQVDFLSHLNEFVEGIGEVLRHECELTQEQPEPVSRKRKLETLMDTRTLADKERTKKAKEQYERLDRLQ